VLIDVLRCWSSELDNSQSACVLFVDFARAFDHADHSTVLWKLRSSGVPKFIVDWLASFLTRRHQRVKIANVCSDLVALRGGMPQGSWPGPLIFLILIDDLRHHYPLIHTHAC